MRIPARFSSASLCVLLAWVVPSCGHHQTTTPDATPPATVTNLAACPFTDTSVRLTWTAPGDDGNEGNASVYDLRYSVMEDDTPGWWQLAKSAANVPAPKPAREPEEFLLASLEPGEQYYFALKTADDVPNWSGRSNLAGCRMVAGLDTVPPAIVHDLEAVPVNESTVRLSWTAPGDDGGIGTASRYYVRYSSCPYTGPDWWSSAKWVLNVPKPAQAGEKQTFTVAGFQAATTYCFALRTEDEAGNISDISNAPRATTNLPDGGGLFRVCPDSSGDYRMIQAAIDAASSGDVIELCDGVYKGEGNRDIDFQGKAVTVRSQSGNAEDCIIDCGGSSSDEHRGFYFHSNEGPESVLKGVKIEGGYIDFGGAVRLEGSSPTLANCVFLGNYAKFGGAVSCYDGSSPEFTNCRFSENTCEHLGGGIFCVRSSPALNGCTFDGNDAGDFGGGMYFHDSSPLVATCSFSNNVAEYGGGLYGSDSSPTVNDCIFSNNNAEYGGGACWYGGSSPLLTNCIFNGNAAITYGGGTRFDTDVSALLTNVSFLNNSASSGGGVICSGNSALTFLGCNLSGNTATWWGGGIYCHESSLTLENVTLSGNQAQFGAAVRCSESSTVTFTNATIFSNSALTSGSGLHCMVNSSATMTNTILVSSTDGEAIYCTESSSAVLACCNVYDNAGGDWSGCIADQEGKGGNISADPLFCDPESGDFYLRVTSPCSPDSSECGLIGAWPVGCEAFR